jgi:hypothetical protein
LSKSIFYLFYFNSLVKVFRRIEKQLPHLQTIELQYASPKLLAAEKLELAVPGTYRSGKPIIKIARFVHKLQVIASKQRPRRLAINGSDGKEYQYLLKGEVVILEVNFKRLTMYRTRGPPTGREGDAGVQPSEHPTGPRSTELYA